MFDEDGLGNYGTEAARPRQPGEGGDEMDEKYQEITHVQHGSKKLKSRGNPGKLAIGHGQESTLLAFKAYFNHHPAHTARWGRPPEDVPLRPIAKLQWYRWESHCRGLHQTPIAA